MKEILDISNNGTESIEKIFPMLEDMIGEELFNYGYFNDKNTIYVSIKQPFRERVDSIIARLKELNIQFTGISLAYEDKLLINEMYIHGVISGEMYDKTSFYK